MSARFALTKARQAIPFLTAGGYIQDKEQYTGVSDTAAYTIDVAVVGTTVHRHERGLDSHKAVWKSLSNLTSFEAKDPKVQTNIIYVYLVCK